MRLRRLLPVLGPRLGGMDGLDGMRGGAGDEPAPGRRGPIIGRRRFVGRGAWELALDGSFRRCGLTLAAEPGPVGQALRFPAGCRRALPVVNGLAAGARRAT